MLFLFMRKSGNRILEDCNESLFCDLQHNFPFKLSSRYWLLSTRDVGKTIFSFCSKIPCLKFFNQKWSLIDHLFFRTNWCFFSAVDFLNNFIGLNNVSLVKQFTTCNCLTCLVSLENTWDESVNRNRKLLKVSPNPPDFTTWEIRPITALFRLLYFSALFSI